MLATDPGLIPALTAVSPDFIDVGHAQVAVRVIGAGPPLLFVHGYPLSGLTWRHVVAPLAREYSCYVVDLPGGGETRWSEKTDFRFGAQAETLLAVVRHYGLENYVVVGHDTGGTISRRLASLDGARVRKLVLIGTEIPYHRPSWIELFQKTSNPRRPQVMRFLMSQRWFRRSRAAFGGCFYDPALIDGEFYQLFIAPLIADKQRAVGQIHYLRGIDWAVVDGMAKEHRKLTMPTLLIWGEDDTVFPVADAQVIARQLPNCAGFVTIPRARLFVQEEKPERVAQLIGGFAGSLE